MFEHDAPQRDEEFDCCVRCGLAYQFAVYVSAVGGCVVGRAVERNWWHYKIIDYRDDSPMWGQTIATGSDFYAPMPTTHRQAAEAIVEMKFG